MATETTEPTIPTYTAKDFTSDQEVRWCPGCGDYAILTAVRKTLPKLRTRKEDYVFVSGIGCAARFPYYVSTYGMHSIHGRAPAFATGVKLANPELEVWIASGDGDLLSIGGNHTMHLMRRNVDVNVLLFNNRIYGLTKGQYSPTSEFGKKTKSTPMGSIDYPVNPLMLALGAGCTFVARSIDVDVAHLESMMIEAAAHKGTALIEIYQDCNIFNHQAFFYASQKDTKADTTIEVVHGKPLVFGKGGDKGIRFAGTSLEVVALGNGVAERDLVVHDETNLGLAFLLAHMTRPEFPEVRGIVYRDRDRRPYDALMHEQMDAAIAQRGSGDLRALLMEGDTWQVRG
jgi:2-oxoglutarate ferredoxin oxidoreductase subunit beta